MSDAKPTEPRPIGLVIVDWCKAHPDEAREGYRAMQAERKPMNPIARVFTTLGGLLPFVHRSKVTAIIGQLRFADGEIARLQREVCQLKQCVADWSIIRAKAEDEVERLRNQFANLDTDKAKVTKEAARLRGEIDRLLREKKKLENAVAGILSILTDTE